LEAAAAGKPVVATRVGGIPEAIEEGKSGILIAPDDYQPLSRSVIGLLSNNKERFAMGQYARERIKEKFCWAKIIGQYQAVLNP
jgi:glycosyltransferase involved in cell wall biosynthesis